MHQHVLWKKTLGLLFQFFLSLATSMASYLQLVRETMVIAGLGRKQSIFRSMAKSVYDSAALEDSRNLCVHAYCTGACAYHC